MGDVSLTAGTVRTSGISSASRAAGASALGSEIDNSANLDLFLDLELTVNHSVAPTANTAYSVYLLFAPDGTNYEDGSESVLPTKNALRSLAVRAVTGDQRLPSINKIPLPPSKFKILVVNNTNQTATLTMFAKTYRESVA